MATKIVTKNSSTGGAVPSASDLVQGELAVNVADKRLFTEDNGGSIVELGTKPSTIDIDGGTIDGTAIGASSASTGAFTTLTATGAFTSVGIHDNADATAITIDGSGNTIFTKSGGAYLQLKDASAVRGAINVTTSDGLVFTTGSSFTERMRITDSGVGIGETSPDALLHLKGVTATNEGSHILFENTQGTKKFAIGAGTSGVTNNNFVVRNVTDSTFPLVITDAGNVGIGVANGDVTNDGNASRTYVGIIGSANRGRLNIGTTASNGADAATLAFTNGTNVLSEITVDTNSGVQNSGKMYINSTDFTSFGTAGSERMRINASGSVDISGCASGTEQFRVGNSSGGTDFGITVTENSGVVLNAAEGGTARNMQFATGGTERARLDSSGNLLVGTTDSSPYTTIEGFVVALNNGSKSAACFGADNVASRTIVNIVNPNGSVGSITTNASATAYNTSSDQRLKENIADADDAGSKIDAIQVRKYDWKADGSHQDYGMIAQELQTVAPEAVSGDADSEEMMGVDYSKLVPLMLKEIQSLRNRVAQLEE